MKSLIIILEYIGVHVWRKSEWKSFASQQVNNEDKDFLVCNISDLLLAFHRSQNEISRKFRHEFRRKRVWAFGPLLAGSGPLSYCTMFTSNTEYFHVSINMSLTGAKLKWKRKAKLTTIRREWWAEMPAYKSSMKSDRSWHCWKARNLKKKFSVVDGERKNMSRKFASSEQWTVAISFLSIVAPCPSSERRANCFHFFYRHFNILTMMWPIFRSSSSHNLLEFDSRRLTSLSMSFRFSIAVIDHNSKGNKRIRRLR